MVKLFSGWSCSKILTNFPKFQPNMQQYTIETSFLVLHNVRLFRRLLSKEAGFLVNLQEVCLPPSFPLTVDIFLQQLMPLLRRLSSAGTIKRRPHHHLDLTLAVPPCQPKPHVGSPKHSFSVSTFEKRLAIIVHHTCGSIFDIVLSGF